jgi:hypothetical protein
MLLLLLSSDDHAWPAGQARSHAGDGAERMAIGIRRTRRVVDGYTGGHTVLPPQRSHHLPILRVLVVECPKR